MPLPNQRPVLVLDLGVHFGAQPRGRDRACVPAEGGVGLRLRDHRQPRAAASFLPRASNAALRSGVRSFFTCFDQRRQGRLGVAGDGEVDLLIAPKSW